MTVTEVKNQVLSHFITRTLFTVADMEGIKIGEGSAEWRNGIVRLALDELEKLDLVRKVHGDDKTKDAWVLARPLNSYTQSVEVSAGAAEVIGNCINGFIAANDLNWHICDKSNLGEDDVMTLVDIIHILLDMQTDDDPESTNDRN